MRQLFIDLDGVLADFDGYYLLNFGVDLAPYRSNFLQDPPNFWRNIKGHGSFYRDLPVKEDALDLWAGVKELHPAPIILTGVAKSVPESVDHKLDWVAEHIDPKVRVICCQSKDKRKHGQPGDVLVDDWQKYQALWEDMGGVFVVHRSARESLDRLASIYAADVLSGGL